MVRPLTGPRTSTGYGHLAQVHHAGFGGFARGAAPALLDRLRNAGIASGTVVDLGCGSGIWPRALTDAGYRVLGIDTSAAMIRLARQQAPQARFRTGSFLDVDLPPCDAVTAIGEVLGYDLEPVSGRRALVSLFRRVYTALTGFTVRVVRGYGELRFPPRLAGYVARRV